MIYDFPEPSSPISQGDIFFGVPILDLTDDELPIIDDEGNVQTLSWEAFASTSEKVSAITAVRPTVAIVGTQECDALRAPNITLFEVRPFRDVERKSKDTNKLSKLVPLITQHARINQKWFYLPADERVGFNEKMGADFLTPIRIPRIALERLLSFRKGRLNEIARQHFRERLAEFFRRYAYDEWYPLTREELAEYQKNHLNAEPFPWQRESSVSGKREDAGTNVEEIAEGDSEKGFLDYLAEGEEAGEQLTDILSTISSETEHITAKLNQHTENISKLTAMPSGVKVREYKKIALLTASDINNFSKRMEDVLPGFEKNVQVLDESYSAYVSVINDVEQIMGLHISLTQMLSVVMPVKENVIGFRDSTLSIRNQNINKELNRATDRQFQALEGVIANIEHVESFALRVIFLIDEKFGKPPDSEDNVG
ncbi:MAG: hypothetical protein QOC99_2827 [Acidobacteriota bacterium]|jgi:hypothetical protein|nr:hypothetical protein [Acidobacteriota bacterium]